MQNENLILNIYNFDPQKILRKIGTYPGIWIFNLAADVFLKADHSSWIYI